MTNLYRHFITMITEMITEMITGINPDHVKLWELSDWMITYNHVKPIVNYAIMCVAIFAVVWIVLSICEVIVTRTNKEIEA